MEKLANAFRAHREASGLTFEELAEASGLARQTLLNLSAGRFYGDLKTWATLAKVWDVSLDDLIAPIWDEQDASETGGVASIPESREKDRRRLPNA